MAYSSKVVDKFEKTLKDPKAASVGRWKPGDEDYDKVGTGIVGAPACGDVMKLQIKCEDIEGEKRIVDAKFKTYGCGSAIASSGQLIDMLKGKTLEVTREVDEGLETIEVNIPAIITCDLRLNEPRYASLPNIMKAKKKQLEQIDATELGIDTKPRIEQIKVEEPPKRKAGIKVKSVAELGQKLKNEAKVI